MAQRRRHPDPRRRRDPWTAYLNGGQLPRGEAFVATVKELAARAGGHGADPACAAARPPHRPPARLLHALPNGVAGEGGGSSARLSYSEEPPRKALDRSGLGVVPPSVDKAPCSRRPATRSEKSTTRCTRRRPLARSRLRSLARRALHIRTLWARTIHDADTAADSSTYAAQADPVYHRTGFPMSSSCPPTERRELVLVCSAVRTSAPTASRTSQPSVRARPAREPRRLHDTASRRVTLALDNDQPGRDGLVRAIERITLAADAPNVGSSTPNDSAWRRIPTPTCANVASTRSVPSSAW